MAIEDVLRDVLSHVGEDIPNPQITGPDFRLRQMRSFMDNTGEEIARRAEWSGMLRANLLDGERTRFNMPDDFHRLVSGGAVRTGYTATFIRNFGTSGFQVAEDLVDSLSREIGRNIVSEQEWDFVVSSRTEQLYYHLRGRELLLNKRMPVRGGVALYVSRNWVNTRAGRGAPVTSPVVTGNENTMFFPEILLRLGVIAQWHRQKGNDYADHLAEYEARLADEIAADRGANS